MGDVHVGEDATILPHSVLLPGSRVGPGETWGGVPAVFIEPAEWQRIKDSIRRSSDKPGCTLADHPVRQAGALLGSRPEKRHTRRHSAV